MSDATTSQQFQAVYVYETPLRMWHWINALAIVVLALTGYFIASPLPSQSLPPGVLSDMVPTTSYPR